MSFKKFKKCNKIYKSTWVVKFNCNKIASETVKLAANNAVADIMLTLPWKIRN